MQQHDRRQRIGNPRGGDMAAKAPNWPTRPEVPIPAPTAVFVILNAAVEMGPRTALAKIVGNHICGRRMILANCSIEVPNPCDRRPPKPFSRKLATANPTIWVAHPTAAAPAANPDKSSMMQMAAELIGAVNTIPTMTAITIPSEPGTAPSPG